jgi:phosphinothricin acetyltransferase
MAVIIIRKAVFEDIESILNIVNHAILHTTANYLYEAQTIEDQQKWWEDKQKKQFPVLVATVDKNVVGFATYGTFREKIGYRFTVEHSVYVAPEYINQGIGSKLLTALIELAKSEGYHTMIGAIDAENQDSIKFHEKFGFTQAGLIKQAAFKFDRWLDLQFVQLML